jgi:hypothetical protein
MNVREAIYSKLSGTSAITALVDYRIYPAALPQGVEYPAISYDLITQEPGARAMGQDPALYYYRFQVSSWGQTLASAQSVADAVITALRDSSGTWGGVGGISAQRCFFMSENEIYNPLNSEETEAYHIAQDFEIWFT